MVDQDPQQDQDEMIVIEALRKMPEDVRKETIRYILSVGEEQKKSSLKLIRRHG